MGLFDCFKGKMPPTTTLTPMPVNQPAGDPARRLLEKLKAGGAVPDDDLFVRAWRDGADVDAMIGLLLVGAKRGVYATDETTTWGSNEPSRWLFRLTMPDGAFVRVDVTREQGADGVRACVPALAPRSVWLAGLDKAHDAIACPVAQLLYALDTRHAPQPAWLARWSARGEPLATAWQEARNSYAMCNLLKRAGCSDLWEAAQAAAMATPVPLRGKSSLGSMSPQMQRDLEAFNAALADAVRSAVPVPPTLAALLAQQHRC